MQRSVKRLGRGKYGDYMFIKIEMVRVPLPASSWAIDVFWNKIWVYRGLCRGRIDLSRVRTRIFLRVPIVGIVFVL